MAGTRTVTRRRGGRLREAGWRVWNSIGGERRMRGNRHPRLRHHNVIPAGRPSLMGDKIARATSRFSAVQRPLPNCTSDTATASATPERIAPPHRALRQKQDPTQRPHSRARTSQTEMRMELEQQTGCIQTESKCTELSNESRGNGQTNNRVGCVRGNTERR